MEQRLTERVELPAELVDAIGPYLARQRWYAGEGPPLTMRLVEAGLPGRAQRRAGELLWAVVEAEGADYQLVMAERPVAGDRLRGHEEAFIAGLGDRVYYDATVDSEMALELLRVASDGKEHAERARPLGVEQSNTSLVYDDRLILKLFRRLSVGPNPDADVTAALAATGFSHVARPLLRWQPTAATWPSASSTWPAAPTAGLWRSPRCGTTTGQPAPTSRSTQHSRAGTSPPRYAAWGR